MSLPEFETLAEAYVAGLAELLSQGHEVDSVTDPMSVASNFGAGDRPSIELLGHGFAIRRPEASILGSPCLQPRLDYYFGLLCWTLSASDEASMLAYYHPRATEFSDDGAHLSGAFGHRLMRHPGGNQIRVLIDRLRADPTSRRAIALVLEPNDNFRVSREYPCAASVQFFIRNGMLDAIVHMRAQQALFVLPYDAFLFMALQSAVAAELGVEIGTYRHLIGTFHIYANELSLAQAVAKSEVRALTLGQMEGEIVAIANALSAWEQPLRHAATVGDTETISMLATRAQEQNPDTAVGQASRVYSLKAAHVLGSEDLIDRAAAMLGQLKPLAGALR